ncbi:acetyl-CoA synthetase-like protein [Martensiomyces pterosporus]|nr:acetyl-CoA synthetase-like protein [Martensiomyces pterosporus]
MIFKSIAPHTDVPGCDMPTFYMEAARLNGAKPDGLAFYDITTKKSLTYGGLGSLYRQIASGLVNTLGTQKGDVIALFASNHVNYAAAFLGIISAGAVCCTVSSVFQASELEYQLKDCCASALFIGEKQVPVVAKAINEGLVKIPSDHIIVMSDKPATDARFRSLASILSDEPYAALLITDKKEASETMAVIVYSSGTTGLPKGVMLSHRNFVSYTVQSAAMFKFYSEKEGRADDSNEIVKSIAVLPFAHIYGLTVLIANSIAGAKTQYLMSKFSIDSFLHAVQDHRIQAASVVPSILGQIIKHENIHKYDLSSLKLFGSGAAPLPAGVHRGLSKLFPVTTINGFGMSETCSGICAMGSYNFIPGSVGFLYSETEAKFVDPSTGKELGVGQEGEFCIRGPSIMLGYLNRPEETARTIDADGFLHTGDIAYINETGHIFITDRIKELIKYKGLQVPPAELEGILMDHPEVKDAAVIGAEDAARGTELPMAYVVLKNQAAAVDEKAAQALCSKIIAWVGERVADHKRLRGGIELIDAIPRNVSGKILRRDLRAKHKSQHGSKL